VVVLGCFDRLSVWRWVSSTKRFDGCSYREVAVTVGALKEFEVIRGHCCLGTRLAFVCGKYAIVWYCKRDGVESPYCWLAG
jgi:hypothetical protein